MREYVDSCRTYEILLQDSGLLPPPTPEWHTFVPKDGDYAHVDDSNTDYIFENGQWNPIEE